MHQQATSNKQDRRQAKSKNENWYVIKVMNEHREGGRVLLPFVREDQRLSEAF
jgi:hypothetical protein